MLVREKVCFPELMLSSLLQGAINARSTKARLVTKNPTIRSIDRQPSPKRAVAK
jgi:hypothetical protein